MVTKKVLKAKQETVAHVITELKDESRPFTKHLFMASWQHNLLNKLQANPPQILLYKFLILQKILAVLFKMKYQVLTGTTNWSPFIPRSHTKNVATAKEAP